MSYSRHISAIYRPLDPESRCCFGTRCMDFSTTSSLLAPIVEFSTRMSWAEALGYFGAFLSIAANSMRTMIPLRCLGIVTNCVFILWAVLCGVYPTLIVNL